MVTGASQEEVMIFRDTQTDKHFIIIYISPSSLSSPSSSPSSSSGEHLEQGWRLHRHHGHEVPDQVLNLLLLDFDFPLLVLDFDLNQSRNGIPITQRGVVWTAIVENRIRGVMDKPQPDYYKVG